MLVEDFERHCRKKEGIGRGREPTCENYLNLAVAGTAGDEYAREGL